jgi:hypothetical protein
MLMPMLASLMECVYTVEKIYLQAHNDLESMEKSATCYKNGY